MAISTGSRALDFALGVGAYSPQVDLPDEQLPESRGPAEIAMGTGKTSPHASSFAPMIKAAAEKYNVPYDLLMGIAQQESSFNPNAIGPKTRYGHAKGMFQFIDDTAHKYGVRNPFDPTQAADGAARYMRDLLHRYNGDRGLAAAAYNTGEHNVDKYLRGQAPLAAQTQDYVPKVMGHAAQFAGQQVQPTGAAPSQPGTRLLTLTDGSEMEVPEAMTDDQVLEHIRKSPNPEMSRLMPAREVNIEGAPTLVPFNMTDEQEIRHHLINQGAISDPTEGKGGRYWNNMVSGLERLMGNVALSTGNKDMAQQFYDKAAAGEYQMYESEVEAAKRKGMIPGLVAEAKQNLLYPGATMLGEYAPAMIPGGGMLGTAARVGSMIPAATGEVMHYAQERGKELTPEEAFKYGIPLAAVETLGLPLKGLGLGAGAVEKGMLRRTAEAGAGNFAKNVAAMTAMEGLQKAGAGEPVLPQSAEDMKRIAEAAAWFAGPHALMEGAMPSRAPEAPGAELRPEPPVERRPEPVEPEVAREEPTAEPTTVTKTQEEIIGEAYADHVRNATARGEQPLAPDAFYQRELGQLKEIEDVAAEPPDQRIVMPPGVERPPVENIQDYIKAAATPPSVQPTPLKRKPKEAPSAEHITETGAPDGGRSAQPEIREEGRGPIEGGEGVQPSGQGIKAPEIRGEEVKVPEEKIVEAPAVEPAARQYPKTKPPESTLPYIPKAELDRMEPDQVVTYHQMRGEKLKKMSWAKAKTLPERDRLDKYQYHGMDNAKIAERMGYSGPEETLQKLEEHGLQNLEVHLRKPISEERQKTIEAGIEDRAQYREAEPVGAPATMEEVVPRKWSDIKSDLNSTVSELKRLREEKAPATDYIDLSHHLEFLRAEAFKGGFHKEHSQWEQKQIAKEKLSDIEILEAEEQKKEKAKKREEEEDEAYFKKFEKEGEEGIYELPEFDYTEPDREVDYSKGEAAKEAHTPESLTKHLVDTYGARKPAVQVTTREAAKVDSKTKAFYDPKTKKVHIVADNIGPKDNVHGLLKHEIGVHAQKLGLKDPEFNGILKHMQGMRDKGVQAVREAYAKVPEGTRPERIHEEALGYLVEHHPNIPLVRRFISWLRRMAHKLTGHAGWLKPEDLSQMAHRILKKDYGVESRPERRDVEGERLRSVLDDNLKAIRERGITKTEKTLTYKETGEKFADWTKEAVKKFRTEVVDATDPMTRHLQKLDRFIPEMGKLRADAIAIEANQGVGLVGHAIENGVPVINKSGSMMVVPGANLKGAVEYAKNKEKGGEELLAYVLRVNIGEHRIKEHAQDIKDIARLQEDILNLEQMKKFHNKMGFLKERDKVDAQLSAKKSNLQTIYRERNIDPETLEGREKLVDAADIAQRDKIMKDHPWLERPVKEVYDSMQGLVDFYHQAGMIDKITADKWKSSPYVPLYKSLEDLAKDPNFRKMFPRSAESLHEIQQIKGFKHSVNMLENLHKHYYGMMLPAIFNHTRKQFVDQSLHLDALHKMEETPGLTYDRALRDATSLMQKHKAGKNTVKVMDNGEEKHYAVQDPDLLHMLSFNRPEIGPVATFFRPATTVKRTMFLKNPGFWGTQLFLDPLFANLTAGSKHLIHPGQAIGNLFKIWMGKSEAAKVLERHGVDVGRKDYAGEKALSYQGAGEPTQFHELMGKASVFRKAMNVLDKIHNTVDEATRVAVYDAVKKDGQRMGLTGQELEDFAVNRARTYINFTARGKNNILNEYRAMTAFTSAAINGADALMRNAKGYGLNAKEAKEVRDIFWKRFMAGISIGTGLAIAQLGSYDGDKNGDLYDQLTSINVGDMFKLPMKWDVGALVYGLPKIFVMTTMLDAADPNSLTARQGAKAAWELVVKNMFPPVHLPDMINPIVESLANRHLSLEDTDYIESPGSLRYAADARGRTNTFLGEFFGNLVGVSGKKADYVGRNYLGKFYEFANAAADTLMQRSEGMPGAEMAVPKTMGAGTFMQDKTRVYGADRIYDAEERAQQELAAFNKFRTSDKDKFASFKQDKERMAYKQAAPVLRQVRENIGAMEKQISITMDSKVSKEAKEARIEQLNNRKRVLIERGNQQVKRMLGEYAP